MNNLASLVAPGVATGDALNQLFAAAKAGGFAYPAVNVCNTNTINATLEAARNVNSPVIVQLSQGGSAFFLGKSIKLDFNIILFASFVLHKVFIASPSFCT